MEDFPSWDLCGFEAVVLDNYFLEQEEIKSCEEKETEEEKPDLVS